MRTPPWWVEGSPVAGGARRCLLTRFVRLLLGADP
jgi:hypothetical protein